LDDQHFAARYGRWALVAGGSEGLGAAFARALAKKGLDLVLVARREEPLAALAGALTAAHGVKVRTLAVDLASPNAAEAVDAACAEVEVGLVVISAADARVAPFFEVPLADKLRAVDLNCRTPLALAHRFGARMRTRRRGGLVFLSSLAGLYGGPYVATYAATKAFDTILAESLAGELAVFGIDVVACVAGPTRTPTWSRNAARVGPAPMDADAVAAETLAALGKRLRVIPGARHRLTTWLVGQLPRGFVVARVAAALRSTLSRDPSRGGP
jgi:short-subunit dehydrogenase